MSRCAFQSGDSSTDTLPSEQRRNSVPEGRLSKPPILWILSERSATYNHLDELNDSAHLAPMNPGTINRRGAPCDLGSGFPFISYARRTSSCFAFRYGMDTASVQPDSTLSVARRGRELSQRGLTVRKLSLLEVGIGSDRFDVQPFPLHASEIVKHAFEGHAFVDSGANGAFCPRLRYTPTLQRPVRGIAVSCGRLTALSSSSPSPG